jgi:hypothetical protein
MRALRSAADEIVSQGRGLLCSALNRGVDSLLRDWLVQGIEEGPISYRHRPSTNCRPALAGRIGYTPTISALEYFHHEGSTGVPDHAKVMTLS